ncbi:MAG: type II CAAX endopeptidase family protein [Bryobacteraceae bacterium]
MAVPSDLPRLALKIVVYIVLYYISVFILGPPAFFLGGYLVGITITGLLAAVIANALCMRIYEHRGIAPVGLVFDRSLMNLALGCLGGFGAGVLVLLPPLLLHVARLQRDPHSEAGVASFVFVTLLLLFGAAGEELLFRGYGFQILLRAAGAWTTVVPVGVIFALMHSNNPHATWFALANTAGFGILFGYAFLRSHDIWLPIGLHFGWNFTLPLFGVNVSGLTMRLSGFTMEWSAGILWSGGAYGPEASILTSGVLFLLLIYLWKAPIRRQPSVLLDPAAGDVTCLPGQPSLPPS